jgi:hypothetical protein
MLQYGLKAGIRQFGERGVEAAFKEMKQLHMRDTFLPLNVTDLSKEERKKERKL